MSDKNLTDKPVNDCDSDTYSLSAEINTLSHVIKNLADKITSLEATSASVSQPQPALPEGTAFVYEASANAFVPVHYVSTPPLQLLLGIDRSKKTLLENTLRFSNGYSANNALLWGARGMGKSTLIKSIHGYLVETMEKPPAIIEIQREDIAALPKLLNSLRNQNQKAILFCDDLSFDQPDRDFKALKTVLEGGLEGKPTNILFYATSNRRHLIPRNNADQEAATGLHANETMDDVIALSDRFGLWLGFHACDQEDYINIIAAYMSHFNLSNISNWESDALNWAKTRGNRSGRTAWQFIQHLAGLHGKLVKF